MNQLQNFERMILEKHGAVVDVINPEGLEVLAPREIQEVLHIPEWVRLGFGTELPTDARRVSLDADLLDRLGSMLGECGRFTRLVIAPNNPPLSHPERILDETLILQNAVYRLQDVQSEWTRYIILRFKYTAISDEKHEGLLDIGYNSVNGATLDGMLGELMNSVQSAESASFSIATLPSLPPIQPLSPGSLERALSLRLHTRLKAFIGGMTRRQERDLQRVFDYHHDLQREAAVRLTALAARGEQTDKYQAERAREYQRLEAITREYQAKVSDVHRKYSMKVDLTWLQTLDLVMPVRRFAVLIRRRKSERLLMLDWNPLTRQLDQAPCEYSHTWERPREVCDDALHLVSPEAHGPCPSCGKAYCRACNPDKCPKCVRQVK